MSGKYSTRESIYNRFSNFPHIVEDLNAFYDCKSSYLNRPNNKTEIYLRFAYDSLHNSLKQQVVGHCITSDEYQKILMTLKDGLN